jgi:hypothetical protein
MLLHLLLRLKLSVRGCDCFLPFFLPSALLASRLIVSHTILDFSIVITYLSSSDWKVSILLPLDPRILANSLRPSEQSFEQIDSLGLVQVSLL